MKILVGEYVSTEIQGRVEGINELIDLQSSPERQTILDSFLLSNQYVRIQ